MNRCILVIPLILLLACSGESEFVESVDEFDYPMDSLRSGKTFVYKKVNTDEYKFWDRMLVSEDGIDYLLVVSYNPRRKDYREKWEINQQGSKLVQLFFYDYPDSLKDEYSEFEADEVEVRNIDDGRKYKGTLWRTKMSKGNFKGEVTTVTSFLREDKVVFSQKEYDVLLYENKTKVEAWLKYLPFFSSESTYTSENTFARGLGLVRYSIEGGEEAGEWVLSEIRDMK